MKEAVLYQKLADEAVRCRLCSHRCLIKPGKRGICSVRENQKGKLYSLVYGKTIAANVDPIEKKPFFHFLPGTSSFSIATAGCNFRCEFCQNWEISQISKGPNGQVIGEDLPPEEVVNQALKNNCRSVAYTYTEPTVFFEYASDCAKLAKKKGLANVFVTNGYQTPETIKEMKGLIDAANIDLKSFSDKFYQKICGARLQPVLDSIRLMHEAGIWVEITTLLIPGLNDNQEELKQMFNWIVKNLGPQTPSHISRFHPDYQLTSAEPTPLATLEMAYQIGKKAGLNYVYLGNVQTQDKESTFCPKCGQLVIKRRGYEIEIVGADKKGNCVNCGQNLSLYINSN